MKVKIECTDMTDDHVDIKITGNHITPWDTYEGRAMVEADDEGSIYFAFEDSWIWKLENEIGICMEEVFNFMDAFMGDETMIECDDIFPPKDWAMDSKHRDTLINTLEEVIVSRLGLASMKTEDHIITARTKMDRGLTFDDIDDIDGIKNINHEWDLYQLLNKAGDYMEEE